MPPSSFSFLLCVVPSPVDLSVCGSSPSARSLSLSLQVTSVSLCVCEYVRNECVAPMSVYIVRRQLELEEAAKGSRRPPPTPPHSRVVSRAWGDSPLPPLPPPPTAPLPSAPPLSAPGEPHHHILVLSALPSPASTPPPAPQEEG